MSHLQCTTRFVDVEDVSFVWNIHDLPRFLRIQRKITSPPISIPGTEGAVCHLVCHRQECPRGIALGTPIRIDPQETLFSVRLESKADVYLEAYVDVLCGDKFLRGSFGNQIKDDFIAKTGFHSNSWEFLPNKTDPVTGGVLQDSGFRAGKYFYCIQQDDPIEIKLALFTPGAISHTVSSSPNKEKFAETELGENIRTLLLDPKHFDVVLKCQSEEFKCHKNILGARSSVFQRMFDVDMDENNPGVVDIDDINPEALKIILEFIYTGEDITKDMDDLANLIYAADKYELKGLLDLCYKRFLNTNDESKLVEMLIIADRHKLDNIKELAMARIAEDKNKFLQDEEFTKHMEKHPKLLLEFVSCLSSIK